MRPHEYGVLDSDNMTERLEGCLYCKHFDKGNGGISCTAYPDGIPFMIQSWEFPHTVPRPGDKGIQFEPIEEER